MNICAVYKNLVRYYTKELKQFDKSEFGWCCEKRQVVCVKNTCEHFEKRTYRRKMRDGLQECLSSLLTQLSTIRQLIEKEMKTTIKKCRNCFAYRQMYDRFVVSFWKNKEYYCTFHHKMIDRDGVCENWQKAKPNYDLTTERIDAAIRDVQIISDYCEKNE